MPLKKLTARRKGETKFVSRGRSHKEHHVKARTLDSMLMPKYKMRFDGNGINTAIWHTAKDLNSGQTLSLSGQSGAVVTTSNEQIIRGGDWNAFSCLPGRQCYMEFVALPLFNPNDTDTPVALKKSSNYCGLELNFGRLVNEAFKNNQTYMVDNAALSSGSTVNADFEDLYNIFKLGFYSFQDTVTDNTYRSKTYDQMMNTVIHYQGGKQVHKFTNTSSLPVYMEFREFTPKEMIPLSLHVSDIAGAGTSSNLWMFPGLYETIMEDREYQVAYNKRLFGGDAPATATQVGQDTTLLSGGVTYGPNNMYDYRAGFNELDDKDFKYKGKMTLTDMRFRVGNAKRVRVDPGETFTYEMILSPYTTSLNKMLRLMYLSMSHITGATQGDQKKFGRSLPFFMHHHLSKGLQVRVTGSSAYAATDSSKKLAQFNSYASNSVNIGVTPSLTTDVAGAQVSGFKAQATHAVQMTHIMSEYHEVRVIPWYRSSNYVRYNTLANAYDALTLTLADDMRAINPADNAMEEVDGDGDRIMA